MDLVWLMETIGEPATLLVAGIALGAAFGVIAQRTGFCTRSAIIDLIDRGPGRMAALWLAAFAAALAGSQWLLATGAIDLDETRFFYGVQSFSGAIAGGLLFGAGMILARGCVSRLIVLGASGNIRALFTLALIALASFVTIAGFASPLRFAVNGLLTTSATGTNDLTALTGFTHWWGGAAGALLALGALYVALRTRLGVLRTLGGIAIGALIPAGWYLTHLLSQQVFEPVQPMSLTYIAPLAGIAGFAFDGELPQLLTAETGFVAGTAAGAFVSAILGGGFSLETFNSQGAAPFGRYAAGGVMMGFGGVLAAGCTIGAGFTGGSVLALASLVSLVSMIAGAALTHIVLDRSASASSARDQILVPAE